MKKYAAGGMSPDEEADLQALKTLKQGDYDVGGPKRRYARGKVKKFNIGGATARKGAGAAQKGAQQGMPMTNPRYGQSKDEPYQLPKGQVTVEEIGEERISGPRMRKGGSVSSASKRADGCAIKGKTRGKFV